MKTLTSKFSVVGAFFSLFLLLTPALAQEANDPSPTAWQAVIAGQIQAFRNHDAPGALSFAAASFHQTFTDPKQFFITIIASGYSPIMESRSQTFGAYKLLSADSVLQDVKLLGNDQSIYEAIYQLDREAAGWRVHGVQLVKTTAVGI